MAALSTVGFPAALGQTCGVHCGTERWDVKTLSDKQSSKVNPTPKLETVHNLRLLPRPRGRLTGRREGIETTVFKVQAILVGYKNEADRDFHVIIADLESPDETMIAEIPDAACAGACASGHSEEFKTARGSVIRLLGPAPRSGVGLPRARRRIVVEIIGVGFFDFDHGQTGRAPNNIELHPVFGLKQVQ